MDDENVLCKDGENEEKPLSSVPYSEDEGEPAIIISSGEIGKPLTPIEGKNTF